AEQNFEVGSTEDGEPPDEEGYDIRQRIHDGKVLGDKAEEKLDRAGQQDDRNRVAVAEGAGQHQPQDKGHEEVDQQEGQRESAQPAPPGDGSSQNQGTLQRGQLVPAIAAAELKLDRLAGAPVAERGVDVKHLAAFQPAKTDLAIPAERVVEPLAGACVGTAVG